MENNFKYDDEGKVIFTEAELKAGVQFLRVEAINKYGGVDTDSLNKMVKDVVECIPPSIRSQFPKDDLQAAALWFTEYETGLLNKEKHEGGKLVDDKLGGGTQVTDHEKSATQTKEWIAPVLSDEKAQAIEKILASKEQNRLEVSAKTRIEKYLHKTVDKTKYYKDLTVIPFCTKAKLEEYRRGVELLGDDANTRIFEEVVDAIENKKPMQVHYMYKPSAVIGVTINTVNTEGKNETKTLNTNDLIGFLITDAYGSIPEQNGLGVKITKMVKVQNKKQSASPAMGRPVLGWAKGKTEVLVDNNRSECIDVIDTIGDNPITKTGSLPIELSFKIKTKNPRKTMDKEFIERTVRVRGTSNKVITTKRKQEYVGVFGAGDGQGITLPTSEAEKEKVRDLSRIFIATLVEGQSTVTSPEIVRLKDLINQEAKKEKSDISDEGFDFSEADLDPKAYTRV